MLLQIVETNLCYNASVLDFNDFNSSGEFSNRYVFFALTIYSIPVEHAVLKQVREDELAVDTLIIQDVKQFLETNYRLVGVRP